MKKALNEQEKQDKYLKQNISNLVSFADKSHITRFSPFLDEHQQMVALSVLRHLKHNAFLLFGGMNDCERAVLGVGHDLTPQPVEFPITALKLTFYESGVNHRDILGSLMGLQIKREVVGDIVVKDDYSIVFVNSEIASFILQSLDRVGKHSVKVTLCEAQDELKNEIKYQEKTATVASLRLDCVVAAIINKSRSIAVEKINGGRVMLNHTEVSSISAKVQDGDVITVRGSGKFKIEYNMKKSNKDRFYISILKRV